MLHASDIPGVTPTRRTMLTVMGLLALGAAPALTACGTTHGSRGAAGPVPVSAKKRLEVSLAAAPQVDAVVSGMAQFAAKLHRATATATDNHTVSPFSIAVAFAMLRAGARGDMARQLDEVFGYPASERPEGSPHEAFNALTAELVSPSATAGGRPAPTVEIANGVFVADWFGPKVQQAYVDTLAAQYGARPETVDFTSKAALELVNGWVAEKTHGRIKAVFEAFDPATVLVLANAVYLKASWLKQFEPERTSTASFSTSTGTKVDVRMMRQTTTDAHYAQTAQWQRVALPYIGNELTMRVVLPREVVTGVPSLTSLLEVATAPVAKDPRELVDLAIPRWDTATSLELLSALASLGLTDLVDLQGIAEQLKVDQAVHRATITVDETGSEAAAVTAIAVVAMSMRPVPRFTMTVDRPFVWAIVHEPSQTPVFVGHVVDPTR
jgi:serpin B